MSSSLTSRTRLRSEGKMDEFTLEDLQTIMLALWWAGEDPPESVRDILQEKAPELHDKLTNLGPSRFEKHLEPIVLRFSDD